MSKISFISSDDRGYNVSRCLSLITSDIVSSVKKANSILVKPNCYLPDSQLSSTHKDALEAVLSFIAPHAKHQITLADGSHDGKTIDAFSNYNYFELRDKYDLTLLDLNDDTYETIDLLDDNERPWQANVSSAMLKADYIISVSPPCTYPKSYLGLSIENLVIGSLPSNKKTFATKFSRTSSYKDRIFNYPLASSKNFLKILNSFSLGFAVVDAYSTSQGNGPGSQAELLPTHWACASTDFVSADLLACMLFNIDTDALLHLKELFSHHKANNDTVVGDSWSNFSQTLKPHSNYISVG